MKKGVLLLVLCSIILCVPTLVSAQRQLIGGAFTNKVSNQRTQPENSASKIDLIATAAAPLGAKGTITFPAAAQSASVTTNLTVEFERLGPGTYELSAIRKSGESVHLGKVVVVDPGAQPEKVAGEDRQQDNNSHQSQLLVTRSELTLPLEFSKLEVTRFVLTDQGGTVMLRQP